MCRKKLKDFEKECYYFTIYFGGKVNMYGNNIANQVVDKNVTKKQKHSRWLIIEEMLNYVEIPDILSKKSNDSIEKIILFGIGIYGEIALEFFREKNIEVLFYCDNDVKKQGKFVNNIKVISPNELSYIDNPFIVITSRHYICEISKQLHGMNLKHVSFDAYFVKEMKNQYKNVYFNLLNEVRSEEVFISILKSMISGEKNYCCSVMENNAFWAIPQFKNTGNEVFIDAGAYVGDTLEQFIWNNSGAFDKIYAFEPGERPYKAMQFRVDRLMKEWNVNANKIICVKAGLGEQDSTLSYAYNEISPQSSNFVSYNNEKECKVKIYSLDSFIKDEAVTMIKADIEGFEIEMLKGAKNTIKRFRPKLAISIYHKPEDLFAIPTFIYSLVPEYKMAIRHHSSTLLETVLYCWI